MTPKSLPPSCANLIDSARWRELDHMMVDDPTTGVPASQLGRSSRGMPWNGISVWHQVGPGNELYIPATRRHTVFLRMPMAAPARMVRIDPLGACERLWYPGEVVIVPAGTPTFWYSDTLRDNVHVDLDPAWLGRVMPEAGDGKVPRLLSRTGARDPLIAHLAGTLLASLDSNAALHPGFADGLAGSLSMHLLEHYCEVRPHAAPALSQRQMKRVQDTVCASLDDTWTTARMAELLNLSQFHFQRCFKAACGISPRAWLFQRRMQYAREQVLSTRRALADIALDAGFGSLSHFSKAFRQNWGQTPSSLRRN
ncbi:helix-turn-helix transcriptional regulator [Pandoraea bronchicola]|uniref:AraC family transcriptional regulator n=1 Tax=Pandoraea bronchicola TaxID=2508287 RepID=A0A5E5BZV9_9BURK|nr:AraC family transcriptional regulator [Pandoraea bronchicola]VVE90495.1 AraC family transcriptional regulator [Pandoraea bronchicola]